MPSPTVRASTTNGTTGSTTINVPTNVNGDLLLWFVQCSGSPATPSGWHLVTSVGSAPATIAYSRVASSEPASYTLTGATFPGMVMVSVQNANNSLNLDASATNSGGSDTAPIAPSLSGLSTSTDLELCAFGYGDGGPPGETFTKPSAMTAVNDSTYVDGTQFGCAVASLALSSSSATSQTASTSAASLWWTISVAVAPLPADTPVARLPLQAIRGNDPWQAAPQMLRQHNVVFRAANPPSYDQQLRPIPAIQQGMAPWQAPIKAQWNVVFRAANPLDPYTWAKAPIPAWQAGMQSWWAPVPALHPTITEFHGATALDWRPVGFPFQAVQQGWLAPVWALHATITELHGATDQDWHPVGFPFQAIGQPWWAPVWGLHPTITEFHGATELDFHPTKFPYPAIQQGWQLQYVRIPPYGPNDIGIVAIPVGTPTGFPLAAVRSMAITAPVAGISGFLSGPGPVVGADPIVVWRHRAGMQ